MLAGARNHAGTSADHLRRAVEDLGLDGHRVLRRVRGLAEGQLVRETVWRVRYFNDDGSRASVTVDLSYEEAVATRDRMRGESGWRGVLVRVTRIRRASRDEKVDRSA